MPRHNCYYDDHRVQAAERDDGLRNIDEDRMTAEVELENDDGDEEAVTVPIKRAVCPTCEGAGKHVNPSIDAGGISAEDFDEDPDFREEYFAGTYDVTCYGCRGLRVALEIDEDNVDKAVLTRLHKMQRDRADYEAESRAERMMGA